jgi:hypothetical protein
MGSECRSRPSLHASARLASSELRVRNLRGRTARRYTLSALVVQTIRLADQPNLFRHRKGTRVVQVGADGYADGESAGVIVDGTWSGDPSGGAYTATYRIKRDRGGYFDADERTLLKRFDTDVELRDEIREKIRTYVLPRSMPPTRDREGRKTMGSLQTGGDCAACGHKIRPGEQGVSYTYPHGVYQFHPRCSALWIEAQRQPRSSC